METAGKLVYTETFAYIGHVCGPVRALLTTAESSEPRRVLISREDATQIIKHAAFGDTAGSAVLVGDDIIVTTADDTVTGGSLTIHDIGGVEWVSFDARVLAPVIDRRWSHVNGWCSWITKNAALIPYLSAIAEQFPDGDARIGYDWDFSDTIKFTAAGRTWDLAEDVDTAKYLLWTVKASASYPTLPGDMATFILGDPATDTPKELARLAKGVVDAWPVIAPHLADVQDARVDVVKDTWSGSESFLFSLRDPLGP